MSNEKKKNFLEEMRDTIGNGALALRDQAKKKWRNVISQHEERQLERALKEEHQGLGRAVENLSGNATRPENIFVLVDVTARLERIATLRQEIAQMGAQRTEEKNSPEAAAPVATEKPAEEKKPAAVKNPAAEEKPAAKKSAATKKTPEKKSVAQKPAAKNSTEAAAGVKSPKAAPQKPAKKAVAPKAQAQKAPVTLKKDKS